MSKAGTTLVLIVTLILPAKVIAQVMVPSDPVYRRAQVMVNDGNAAAGRALIDSMLAKAPQGSNELAEGLYWRAVLAPTAAEAESDYRRIIVEHPLSPRVEDVLLRLAQLEIARANYDAALLHLARLTREHPEGQSRARASYWTARVLFEKNDTQRACIANADALARTPEDQAELRNQITYLNQRCAGVALTTEASVPAATVAAAPDTSANPASSARDTASGQPASSAARPTSTAAQPPKQVMQPPEKIMDATPTMVPTRPVAAETPTEKADAKPAAAKLAAAKPAAKSESGYTIQIAAYNVKAQAQAMATKLKQKGYAARVSGTSAPYRVRIGRYDSRAEANAVLRSLRAKKIDGIVVQAE